MKIIGIILLVVGAIMFYGAKIIYKKNKKSLDQKVEDNKEFLFLLNNGMNIVRIIGTVLVVLGAIFIIFLDKL